MSSYQTKNAAAVEVNERRVLEVLDFADGRLLAVRMLLDQKSIHRVVEDFLLAVQGLVLLLINDLQLGLEQTEDRPMKALRLDDRPLLQPIGRQTDPVHRRLVPRDGLEPFLAHGFAELVEFAGDKKSEFLANYKIPLISRRFISRNHLHWWERTYLFST